MVRQSSLNTYFFIIGKIYVPAYMETNKRFTVSGLYKSKHLLIVFTGRTGTALLLQPNKSSSAELCA